jgi:hypothetical protein
MKLSMCAAIAAAVLCLAGDPAPAGDDKSNCPVECGRRARAALAMAGTRSAPVVESAPMPRAAGVKCVCGVGCDCAAGVCPACPVAGAAEAKAKAADGATYVMGADGVYRPMTSAPAVPITRVRPACPECDAADAARRLRVQK